MHCCHCDTRSVKGDMVEYTAVTSLHSLVIIASPLWHFKPNLARYYTTWNQRLKLHNLTINIFDRSIKKGPNFHYRILSRQLKQICLKDFVYRCILFFHLHVGPLEASNWEQPTETFVILL